jgi:hypothetical protein
MLLLQFTLTKTPNMFSTEAANPRKCLLGKRGELGSMQPANRALMPLETFRNLLFNSIIAL